MDSTVVRWSCLYWQKKQFLPDIYAKYLSDIKMFVHKVKEREKMVLFLFFIQVSSSKTMEDMVNNRSRTGVA